jgi:pyruvate dehydrogenase E2 component (dihydrolipoamide acetyltransferase)
MPSAPARTPVPSPSPSAGKPAPSSPPAGGEGRIVASPLAKRIAADKGIDLAAVRGSGPHGRIVKADLEGSQPSARAGVAAPAPAPAEAQDFGIPHEVEKLSSMRKTIARRLTESKQTIPHIYLTVDINLDKLLKLRAEINDALASQGVKVSVNDMLIKALAKALIAVPVCNVQFAGDNLLKFSRADISVAVSIPGGLITPIVVDAGN